MLYTHRDRVTNDMTDRAKIRTEVDKLLPNWRSWYPSLFHAAEDLGVIRARVCSPDSLMLSNRHSSIHNQALAAHREQWGGSEKLDNDRNHKK
jgi:hypothetical protein